jgi:hypothetical protein
MATLAELFREQITLTYEGMDRILLNGYIPSLQTPAGVANFFLNVRHAKVLSHVLFEQMTQTLVTNIEALAKREHIPIIRVKRGDNKESIARQYYAKYKAVEGIAVIVVAQEKARSFASYQDKKSKFHLPDFRIIRASREVNHYYFYLRDREFGDSCFVKMSSYLPFTLTIWANGHEWAATRLRSEQIPFEKKDNAFLACANPGRLQEICDELTHDHVRGFAQRWIDRLPTVFTREERNRGYRHALSIIQMEQCHNLRFQNAGQTRKIFDQLLRDNLELGRPDKMQIFFGRKVIKTTPGRFQTRILVDGTEASLKVFYKERNSIKQYVKHGCVLRTETTICNPKDFQVNKGLGNLPYLRKIASNANRRMLDLQGLALRSSLLRETFERITLPSEDQGKRIPGLRFGNPRVMALFQALSLAFHVVGGFTNRDLRKRMAQLSNIAPEDYPAWKVTYDVRRLCGKGLVKKIRGQSLYVVTPLGRQVALFFTKAYQRVLVPVTDGFERALPINHPRDEVYHHLDEALDAVIQQAGLAA